MRCKILGLASALMIIGFAIMFAPKYDDNPIPKVSSNVSTFCRSFNVENQTLIKHFTCTSVNMLFLQGWLVLEVFIVIPSMIFTNIQEYVLL